MQRPWCRSSWQQTSSLSQSIILCVNANQLLLWIAQERAVYHLTLITHSWRSYVPGLVMRETRKKERMGRRELLSKLPTGVTLPMHPTPAIVSAQHLPAGSSNSRRRTSLSVFAYLQKETLPQIWTLLKCLQLQSSVQEWPHDNMY